MGKEFLVTVHTDRRLQEFLLRPLVVVDSGGWTVIPKDGVLCDVCNSHIAVVEDQLKHLPTGYALCDDESIYEVLCQSCRDRHFPRLPVYRNVEEGVRSWL